MDLRWIARPYHWPLLGPYLEKQARKEGQRIAHRLVARGHLLEEVIKHGNQGVIKAAAVKDDHDLYLHLGLVNAARKLQDEETTDDEPLS